MTDQPTSAIICNITAFCLHQYNNASEVHVSQEGMFCTKWAFVSGGSIVYKSQWRNSHLAAW